MKNIRSAICLVSIIMSMLISVIAQSGGNFTITKSVIAGGGGSATGGAFTLDGTIGQSVAGTTSSGGTFELGSGFWGGGTTPVVVEVSVSGRVTTPAGNGLRNAIVTITDQAGVPRSTLTTSFGFYNFDTVAAGQTYVIRVSSKRFRFASRSVQVNNTLTDIDFVGLE